MRWRANDNLITLDKTKKSCDVRITNAEYIKIVNGFMKFIADKVINGEDVKLPNRMGSLVVIGKKIKLKIADNGFITGASVDWKATNELWARNPEAKQKKKRIYFFNEHSNGIRYNVRWFKGAITSRYKNIYSFQSSRRFLSSKISSEIKKGKEYKIELKV